MEYCNDGDLMAKVAERRMVRNEWDEPERFSEDQVLEWFTMIALAVKHCHDRCIIHGDLKSQNIFLCRNGMAKVGDFGLSSILNDKTTIEQEIVGTPYYMAPELLEQL